MRVFKIGDKMLYNLKIVYTGLPYAGKTTNLRILAKQWSIDTGILTKEGERTIYFDHLSKKVIDRGNNIIRVSAYSVPGQEQYRKFRESVMEDMDVMVFVADMDPDRVEQNMTAYEDVVDIVENVHHKKFEDITTIVQYNKYDLSTMKSLAALDVLKGTHSVVNTIAKQGVGVIDTFLLGVNQFFAVQKERIRITEMDLVDRDKLYENEPIKNTA